MNGLRDLRHSLLHQRYDSMPTQVEFIRKFAGGQRGRLVELLLEGCTVYENYVKRMGLSLRGGGNA